MAHVSHKLSTAFQGALAGGGDPATSPLYIFGPFLKLIVVAGVASVTFGSSVWLVVLTIATVSAMYRLVMGWVTDGSGGSGLSEEEFGSWAVRVNAGITFIEYTLTFLVSMAALVTFVADRFPFLNEAILGLQYRTILAIGLSILTGWLVNRGPKMAAIAFGPATAAVLLLLWVMVFATIWKLGFHLPTINLEAFSPGYLNFTFGGFARILAVMTGIEVFANLVAAYEGEPAEKSKKAFGSLIIIMGTTSITMLIVGPAIFQLADPTNEHVSVFTQTMDQLLPPPLPYIGTLIGVAVLLSASAASAQGLQNLAVGLKYRHYLPRMMGRRNRFDVADKPVWLEVGIVAICFLLFGTSEETYLAIYAAGVFILLSMTGWAASKRLIRELRQQMKPTRLMILGGTIIAAILTSGATIVIFAERFSEGAWTYFIFIPLLYLLFGYFRHELGRPTSIEIRLGKLIAGSGPLASPQIGRWHDEQRDIDQILVPLDGSQVAEQALPVAEALSRSFKAAIALFTGVDSDTGSHAPGEQLPSYTDSTHQKYLTEVEGQLRDKELDVSSDIGHGPAAGAINQKAEKADLIVMSTHGRSGIKRLLIGSVASEVVRRVTKPVLLTRSSNQPARFTGNPPFKRIMVTLDGSEFAERVLPYVKTVARRFNSEVHLLIVPETAETEAIGLKLQHYLEGVAEAFTDIGVATKMHLQGVEPIETIVEVSEQEAIDLIMMATHGRSGLKRIIVGSVADAVVRQAPCPVFLVPIHERGS